MVNNFASRFSIQLNLYFYLLLQCHCEYPQFQQVTTLTLRSSLNCIGLTLWDEGQRKLVGFEHLKSRRAV